MAFSRTYTLIYIGLVALLDSIQSSFKSITISTGIPYHDRVKSCAVIVAKKKNVCVHVITQKLRDNKCTPPYTITDLDQDLKLCLKSPLLVYPI